MDKKGKVIGICVISILILGVFIVIYKGFIANESQDTESSQTTVPKVKAKEKFTYEDMMKYREADDRKNGRAMINIDSNATIDTLNFKLADEGTSLFSDSDPIEDNAFTPVQEEKVYPAPKTASKSYVGYTPKHPSGSSRNDLYNVDAYRESYNEIRTQNEPQSQLNNYPSTTASAEPQTEVPTRRRREGFIGSSGSKAGIGTGVSVIVFGDQVIESGESVKLRVTKETKLNGSTIPKNSIAYGVVSRGQNRLNITVSSIQSGGRNIPVNLNAYDATDGMAGLKVSQQAFDNTTDNIKSQAGEEVLSATGISSLPVIGMLGRGAKDLLTRRKSNNSIIVTNNYQLILK